MTNSAAPNERRRHRRVRGPFHAVVHEASGHRSVRVIDVTAAGCYINTPTNAAPNDRVELTLHLPYAAYITVSGRVVYVETGLGFGAEFVDVQPATHQELSSAVSLLAK